MLVLAVARKIEELTLEKVRANKDYPALYIIEN
jgi:hypothetical protein